VHTKEKLKGPPFGSWIQFGIERLNSTRAPLIITYPARNSGCFASLASSVERLMWCSISLEVLACVGGLNTQRSLALTVIYAPVRALIRCFARISSRGRSARKTISPFLPSNAFTPSLALRRWHESPCSRSGRYGAERVGLGRRPRASATLPESTWEKNYEGSCCLWD
jgi:hypothetical protein